jgi:solute carrier family 30 (zinc transporter), member 9
MAHGSKKAVVTAIFVNAGVTVIKFLAGFVSHSTAMMNEAIHSLMDTLNQGFLYLGLREAERPTDRRYAFGHMQKKYLWNLWSAIGLFSLGCGLGLSHAWHAWKNLGEQEPPAAVGIAGHAIDPVWISVIVLVVAFVLEGYSFLVALREFLARMRADGFRNPLRYLVRSDDPTLTAIVLEDSVAMLGLVFAAAGIGLTLLTGNPFWDIGFSAVIAVMLGLTAFFLGLVNMRYLADMRDVQAESAFADLARECPEVERHHDLRSIVLDENHTVLVSEISLREDTLLHDLEPRIVHFRETALAALPPSQRADAAAQARAQLRAVVQATLERTESVIDRLEARVRERAPQVTHVTIEVEGMAPAPVSAANRVN